MRLARDGLVTFDSNDGLRGVVRQIIGGRGGKVYIVMIDESVYELDGQRFRGARPHYPRHAGAPTWGSWHLPDPKGGWWVPTNAGLCRYDAGDRVEDFGRARASFCYTTSDGLPSNDIALALFDSRGALWIGTRATIGPVVARKNPSARTFAALDIVGLSEVSTPVALVEDTTGQDLDRLPRWRGGPVSGHPVRGRARHLVGLRHARGSRRPAVDWDHDGASPGGRPPR